MMEYLTRRYAFPIPTLTIHVGPRGERPWPGPLTALLDTGADMTLMPMSVMHRIQADPSREGRLRTHWGESHLVLFFLVEMEIDGIRLGGIQVAADEITNEIVLGRNVLDKLPLFLDGPQQVAEIVDEVAVKRLRGRRKKWSADERRFAGRPSHYRPL